MRIARVRRTTCSVSLILGGSHGDAPRASSIVGPPGHGSHAASHCGRSGARVAAAGTDPPPEPEHSPGVPALGSQWRRDGPRTHRRAGPARRSATGTADEPAVAEHVEYVTVRVADEEAAYSPGFVGEGVHDLGAFRTQPGKRRPRRRPAARRSGRPARSRHGHQADLCACPVRVGRRCRHLGHPRRPPNGRGRGLDEEGDALLELRPGPPARPWGSLRRGSCAPAPAAGPGGGPLRGVDGGPDRAPARRRPAVPAGVDRVVEAL